MNDERSIETFIAEHKELEAKLKIAEEIISKLAKCRVEFGEKKVFIEPTISECIEAARSYTATLAV